MRKMYRSSDLMMKIFSGNKKYIFPRFQLYARVYVRINLVPRAFPLKNGWDFSRPTHFLREKTGDEVVCVYGRYAPALSSLHIYCRIAAN